MNRLTNPIARAAALLIAAAVLASCASIERDTVAAPPDGGAVEVRAGTPLVVSLPPDPSTGYGWVLQSANPNLALIGGPDYTPAPKPPGLVGVADTTAYRFRALKPGAAALEFTWVAPPGQPAPSPARTVRYDVNVTPGLPSSYRDFLGSPGKDGQSTVK
jgi:inhibitor of cysteine peptidase